MKIERYAKYVGIIEYSLYQMKLYYMKNVIVVIYGALAHHVSRVCCHIWVVWVSQYVVM